MRQKAVRRIHLEARRFGVPCGIPERHQHLLDVAVLHRPRRGPQVSIGERTRCQRFPRRLASLLHILVVDRSLAVPGPSFAGLAAGVGELDAGHGALLADEAGDPGDGLDLGVAPEAQVAVGPPTPGLDGGGLREDQSGAPQRKTPEVDQVPVVRDAVGRDVLAHGRDDDAVRGRDAA